MSFGASAMVLTWLAILFLALAVAGLIRQVRILARSLPESRISFHAARGAEFAARSARLVLFLDTECRTCDALEPDLKELIQLPQPEIVLAFKGSAVWPWLTESTTGNGHGTNPVIVPEARVLFEKFHVRLLPYLVALDRDDRVLAAQPIGSSSVLRTVISHFGDGATEIDPVF